MRIGVPRECKDGERRVAMLPEGVAEIRSNGHQVLVQEGAGEGAGFGDAEYRAAGARIIGDAASVFAADMVVKVKELQPSELPLLTAGTTIFGFAHLDDDAVLCNAVVAARVRCIGYETVRDAAGGLPLLAPMSQVAGRLAPLIAASLLLTDRGGSGVLLPGLAGEPAGHVTIVGAGMAGSAAVAAACGLGSRVTVFARTEHRLPVLRTIHGNRISALVYDAKRLAVSIAASDVVIGAVLVRGQRSPTLVTRAMLATMRRGSVLVDIGIDKGGIAETSRPTTISAPTYVEEGVTHYCVANLPALVPRTASIALARVALPYVLAMAKDIDSALRDDAGLRAGMQTYDGRLMQFNNDGAARQD